MKNHSIWRDKCVLITGASSGLGRALAEQLAPCGAKLGLLARRGELLDQLAEQLRARGTTVAVAAADVCDAAAMRTATAALEKTLGPCDVLIANAGVHRYTPGFQFLADAANQVLTTNVQGVVNAAAATLPGMTARRRGHLVAVASLAGFLGLPQVGAYCASKAALITLMDSLRIDLDPYGIQVSTICPGFIETPLLEGHDPKVLKFLLTAEDAARRIIAAVERGRRTYCFPWQTTFMVRLGRWLPYPLYRWIIGRMGKNGRAPATET